MAAAVKRGGGARLMREEEGVAGHDWSGVQVGRASFKILGITLAPFDL